MPLAALPSLLRVIPRPKPSSNLFSRFSQPSLISARLSSTQPTLTTMPPLQLKTPKGTKDWDGRDDALRSRIFSTIRTVFERRGGEPLDTPVFERKEILANKYGEDSKLIYDLQDQGGELCSLRYDLTVPFARYMAMNGLTSMKRYQFGKVYRRDAPAMTKGRMREFWQCDFDIAGRYDPMIADAELLRLITQVFDALGWRGQYTIKMNHRKILDGLFSISGVPPEKFRTISSAVDKLDKSPWSDVKREMVEEKGLEESIADKIGTFVNQKGGADLLKSLQADPELSAEPAAKEGLQDMEMLFAYLAHFNVLPVLSFDMSLARGLDYYTGLIYEVITEGSAPSTTAGEKGARTGKKEKAGKKGADAEDGSQDPNVGVGSVAAGGRYDNLIKDLAKSAEFKKELDVPCVGVSFGVERIFSIMKARAEASPSQQLTRPKTEVYVMAFPKGLLHERMEVASTLEQAGISTAYMWKEGARLDKQFKEAEGVGAVFSVILGEEELRQGLVKVKENGLPAGHEEKDGVMVGRGELVGEMKKKLEGDESKRRLGELRELSRKAEAATGKEKEELMAELLKKLSMSGTEVNGLPMR